MPDSKFDIAAVDPHLADLIAGIAPSHLAQFLRDAEPLASTVLRGFRATPQTMKSPIVRQRLMRAVEDDPELLRVLVSLWADSNRAVWGKIALRTANEIRRGVNEMVCAHGIAAVRLALLLDDRQSVRRLAEKIERLPKVGQLTLPEETESPQDGLPTQVAPAQQNDETQQFKARLRDAEHRIRELERAVGERAHDVQHLQTDLKAVRRELADRVKELERSKKDADRQRRARESAEREVVRLQHELKRAKKVEAGQEHKPPQAGASGTAGAKPSADWVPTISAMLKAGALTSAAAFCETVLARDPGNIPAHLVLEHVYGKTGDDSRRVQECIWIARHFCETNQAVRGCAFACRALEANPDDTGARKVFKQVLGAVDPSDESAGARVRGLLTKLRLSNPAALREAHKLIKQLGKRHVHAFEGQPVVVHPDKVLDFSDGKRSMQLSIAGMVDAINSNDVGTVQFLRRALAKLRSENPGAYRSVVESIETKDDSCVCAVVRDCIPVVVDGSNVAWHESGEKPRLQNILDVRRELRSNGYFPVYIYVDAALPHQVDRKSVLTQLIENGSVLAADSHTDADEAIIRHAEELGCPVVTNDRMIEWDPDGRIPKLRFALDNFGVTFHER